jgi:hypothetical protein
MITESVRFLLRVDDLCPTVNREPWMRLAVLIEKHHLKPILAIVPDNRDPGLRVSRPDESFWEQMRAMQHAGAAIALHGYQHKVQSLGRSLVPLHRESEFAGVSESVRREWIRAGLEILRAQRLSATMWVAPRHGFDRHTLNALHAEGIDVLSDGLARRPFLRAGITWIPQQLWAPPGPKAEKRPGLWTICLHPNTISGGRFDAFAAFVREHAAQFNSVDAALAQFPPSRLTFWELLRESLGYSRLTAAKFKRAMKLRLYQGRDPAPRAPEQSIETSRRAAHDTALRAGRARPRD